MVLSTSRIPTASIRWRPCYRIIPSRFPPIALFEDVADPADLDAVFRIESLTNDRLRDEAGEISRVPPEDRVSGPGTSYIMSAFTHLAPGGGRFTDGSFGAFYTAPSRETAIAETVYHQERFLRESAEPPMNRDMRVLRSALTAELHDLRGLRAAWPEIYDPVSYTHSQALARTLRAQGSQGIAYDSVRHAGGECAAVFRPRALAPCKQAGHLDYAWDGAKISLVYEKKVLRH